MMCNVSSVAHPRVVVGGQKLLPSFVKFSCPLPDLHSVGKRIVGDLNQSLKGEYVRRWRWTRKILSRIFEGLRRCGRSGARRRKRRGGKAKRRDAVASSTSHRSEGSETVSQHQEGKGKKELRDINNELKQMAHNCRIR